MCGKLFNNDQIYVLGKGDYSCNKLYYLLCVYCKLSVLNRAQNLANSLHKYKINVLNIYLQINYFKGKCMYQSKKHIKC